MRDSSDLFILNHKLKPNKLLLISIALLWLIPTKLWGQSPADGISYQVDGATNTIFFQPTCNGVALGASVLNRYHWFWDFGNGDFSLEATPQRKYFLGGGSISNVSLRVTNIKDDDPEEENAANAGCPAGNCNAIGESYEEALPNDIWECVTNEVLAPAYVGAGVSGNAQFSINVLPSYAPKPGHLIKYAINIKNYDTRSMIFGCRVDASSNLTPTNGANPRIWPESVTINTANNLSTISDLTIPPDAERTVVLEYRLEEATALGSSEGIRVTLNGFFVSNPTGGNPDTTGTLKGTRQNLQSVQSAWDPNFIRAYPGEKIGLGQKILYHVHFENIGNAPTEFIKVEMDLPDALTNVQVIGHRFANSVPETDCPSGDGCRFYAILDGDTIYRFQDRRLMAEENGEFFIEALVPENQNLCGNELEAKLKVAFNNSANVLRDHDITRIGCPSGGNTTDCPETPKLFWYIAVIVVLILLLILLIYLLLRSRRP